jgi:hypothetical protein
MAAAMSATSSDLWSTPVAPASTAKARSRGDVLPVTTKATASG